MHRTTATWSDFRAAWDGVQNFLVAGECVPFAFDFPPLAEIVDQLRRDPGTDIRSGIKGDRLDLTTTIAEEFRALPIARAMETNFALAHYRLSAFDAPGGFLHGFKPRVVEPWTAALTAAGFTFTRCYPIVFISGTGCATNYHMDFSHVLAWQVYGRKRFCGLRDPDRWAPRGGRVTYRNDRFPRPAALTEADALCFDMRPGDVLWNALLTPHWVEAGGEVAMSINLSHGGLRLDGKLCPHEQELMDYLATKPAEAPSLPTGGY